MAIAIKKPLRRFTMAVTGMSLSFAENSTTHLLEAVVGLTDIDNNDAATRSETTFSITAVTVPNEELALLTNTVVRAVDNARAGLLADGHGELVYGLRRVEALHTEALENGDPAEWMPELLIRWQSAINRYCGEYGVRMGIE